MKATRRDVPPGAGMLADIALSADISNARRRSESPDAALLHFVEALAIADARRDHAESLKRTLN